MTINELKTILKYSDIASTKDVKITISYPDGTFETLPISSFSTYSDVLEFRCESNKED